LKDWNFERPNLIFTKFLQKKKKDGSLFIFFPTELPEWPTSGRVFCLVWPPNPTKHAPKCPPGTPLSRGVVRSGQKGLKRLRLLAQSVHLGQSANLAVRGAHFEPTVWIAQVESRADIFSPLKTRLPSFQPYKYEQFSCSGGEEKRAQSCPKTSLLYSFSANNPFLLPLSTVAFSHHPPPVSLTTSSGTVHHHPGRQLPPRQVNSLFPAAHLPSSSWLHAEFTSACSG